MRPTRRSSDLRRVDDLATRGPATEQVREEQGGRDPQEGRPGLRRPRRRDRRAQQRPHARPADPAPARRGQVAHGLRRRRREERKRTRRNTGACALHDALPIFVGSMTLLPADRPPNKYEKNKAVAILKKAARDFDDLVDETGGRNNALMRVLPTLYRLVEGKCLTADEVDDV